MVLLTACDLFSPNAILQVILRKEKERQVKRRTSPDEVSDSEVFSPFKCINKCAIHDIVCN